MFCSTLWARRVGGLIVGGLFTVAAVVAGEDVVVNTPQGDLIGSTVIETGQSIRVFKGVPYAVPPVGQRRWKPTQPAPGWQGKRLAKNFGPACMQPATPEGHFYYNPMRQTSEDCLYLNIWTGADLTAGEKRPVMVWIHGGSLVDGAGSVDLYNGAALARKGVVVVTINYRLNVFGYFSHPELSAESPHGGSGNYGTLDQIQALKWVQQNISAYGGDPNNVTIFGESAGALSVSHLMVTPLSKGLFHRAIMQSSYLPPSLQMTEKSFGRDSAESIGKKVAQQAGVKSLAELRDLSAAELLSAATAIKFYPETVVDNYVFTQGVQQAFANGEQHQVPLMAGFNSGEVYPFATFGLVPPVPASEESYLAEVNARYGDLAGKYLSLYPANDVKESVFAASRDGFYGWATEFFIRGMPKVGANAYLYYFDHITPAAAQMGVGAYHAGELPYVFNNVKNNAKYSPSWPDLPQDNITLRMASVMSDFWVAFAKYGKPKVTGQPDWRPFKTDAQYYMAFKNGDAHAGENLMPGMFELHNQIVADRRAKGGPTWWLHEISLFAPVIEPHRK